MGQMTEWKNRFCLEDTTTPVTVVEKYCYGGGASVDGSASSQSRQSQGGHVFVFKSGHRYQITCSLLGGFYKPRTAVAQSLDSGLCSMLSS